MPKESKSSAPRDHRKLPYPAVSSSTSMAPYTITSLSVTPQNAVSPPPSDGNHHSSWSKDNDELLMRARHQGLNWQPIADTYFPNKSANACRKRHERLIEKRKNTDDWDAARMETLAKAYNDVREQMWRILADRMGGEKWQIVESKVNKTFHPFCLPASYLINPTSAWRKVSKRYKTLAVPPPAETVTAPPRIPLSIPLVAAAAAAEPSRNSMTTLP